MKVSPNDTDVMNLWKRVKGAKVNKGMGHMRHHLVGFSLLVEPFLRHTKAMKEICDR